MNQQTQTAKLYLHDLDPVSEIEELSELEMTSCVGGMRPLDSGGSSEPKYSMKYVYPLEKHTGVMEV
jgi:hypothetical protein